MAEAIKGINVKINVNTSEAMKNLKELLDLLKQVKQLESEYLAYQLATGKKTINEIRNRFGLEPLTDPVADELMVTADAAVRVIKELP